MEFGFGLMSLHKIYSLIYSDNKTSLRNTVHGGFKVEGHLREHVVDPKTNQRVDVVQTGLLRSDLNSAILDKLSRRLLGRRLAV
jgi:RimJ/RimL family protein N-acetyltransferase